VFVKINIAKMDDYFLWCDKHAVEVDHQGHLEDPYARAVGEKDKLDLIESECQVGGECCYKYWYIVFNRAEHYGLGVSDIVELKISKGTFPRQEDVER
jgi:hypothetical protein